MEYYYFYFLEEIVLVFPERFINIRCTLSTNWLLRQHEQEKLRFLLVDDDSALKW